MIIRINVNHEENIIITKERKTTNVTFSIIENILLQREIQMRNTNFNVQKTWYIVNEWPGGFLNEKNIEIIISFQ